MEIFVTLIVVGIFVALIAKAAQAQHPDASIKNEIKGAAESTLRSSVKGAAESTLRSLGKAAATVQNGAIDAKREYAKHRDKTSDSVAERAEKYEVLARLKSLLDAGAISQNEFDAEKRKLLDQA